MNSALILGGNGFIGHHMARRLRSEGYWVRCVDIKQYEYGQIDFADEVVLADLRDYTNVEAALRLQGQYSLYIKPFEEVQQFDLVFAFCCNMGGAGYVFTGENDAKIIHDSAVMNLHIAEALRQQKFEGKLFYSSSACMYPQELQTREHIDRGMKRKDCSLKESDAYPANPDSEYGWEKLFSERLYQAYARNHNLDIRIARFHNIYGPEGTYKGGKEKAPAAMCRKVIEPDRWEELGQGAWPAEAGYTGSIKVWGTGNQTRSFLYIDDCIDAVRLLMESEFKEPINIGSEEMVSINDLAQMAIDISGKRLVINNVPGPVGVNGRNSNNDLARKVLNGWEPKYSLRQGMELTYDWILHQYK